MDVAGTDQGGLLALPRVWARADDSLSALHRVAEVGASAAQQSRGQRRRTIVAIATPFGDATDPITQDDLVGLVGASRPTVTHAIGLLAEEGLLSLGDGEVRVPDRKRLRVHAR